MLAEDKKMSGLELQKFLNKQVKEEINCPNIKAAEVLNNLKDADGLNYFSSFDNSGDIVSVSSVENDYFNDIIGREIFVHKPKSFFLKLLSQLLKKM